MSTTFKKFRKDSIVRTKYTAHKKYEVKLENFSGSQEGFEDFSVIGYESEHVNAFLLDTETGRFLRHDEFLTGSIAGTTYTELQTTNGFFKRSLHNSIAHLYYNGSHAINVNLDKSFCVEPTRNEYRELNGSAQIISIPQQLFGDKIKETDAVFDPGNPSLRILSGNLDIREDGFGNLYDTNAGGFSNALGIYSSLTGSLVGYWGFNELYPYHQDNITGHCPSFFVSIKDGSRYQTDTRGSTIFIHSQSKHGSGAMLTGQRGNIYDGSKFSYFRAKKHQNIDLRKDEDFALTMWAQLPPSQSDTTGLFNYIVTSGEGFHPDATIESGFHKSKFPFDLVMYNQTAGVKETATLTFTQRNYADSAAKQLFRFNSKNIIETGSATTASIGFSVGAFHNGAVEGVSSASFQFGRDLSNMVTVVVSTSTAPPFAHAAPNKINGTATLSPDPHPNLDNVIYVPKSSTAGQTALDLASHIEASASSFSGINMIGARADFPTSPNFSRLTLRYSGHKLFKNDSVQGENFDSLAGVQFQFRKDEHSTARGFNHFSHRLDNVDGIRFHNNPGGNEPASSGQPDLVFPHILRQPSESAAFQIKDVFGTKVRFEITSASIALYPSVSVHGSVTSSAQAFADAMVRAINAGIETGATGSETGRQILRVSASHIPSRAAQNTYAKEILITSSVAGNFVNHGVSSAGEGHDNMQVIINSFNTFNNYPVANTPETTDTSPSDGFEQAGSPYPEFFTGSFFILSCRPTESYAPSENVDPDPASHEKHVFYWSSGSSAAPSLGNFVTHSTTEIDLGAAHFFPGTTAEISGAFDYYNVASRSFAAIQSHPSFSVKAKYRHEGTVFGVFDPTFDFFPLGGFTTTLDNNLLLSGSITSVITSSFFPKINNDVESNGNNNVTLLITAVNQGITPVVESGSQFGPLFSSSVNFSNPIPTPTASMVAQDGTIGRPGQILARRNDGINLYQISSSALFEDKNSAFKHIVFQKTGSNLELYIDNQLQQSLSAPDRSDPKNKNDIYFGVATRMTWSGEYEMTVDGQYRINPGTGNPVRKMAREFMRPISGALDEINLFDKALNPNQREFLYNCPNGTPYVGNVMHEHGIVTITHPSGAYSNIARNCTASFKNTFEITENSFTAEIKRGEFNFTANPTIIDQSASGKRESKIASFITDTDWDPYITTIGLYDDSARLLAVGKLSRPLRKDDGYDTTIEVRFDT